MEITCLDREETADPYCFATLDAVFICTPPDSHALLTIKALKSGCNVMVEKPMADSLHSASLMLKTARDTRRILAISHNFLFSRAMQRAQRLLPLIGTLLEAHAEQLSSCKRRLPPWYQSLPAGLFWDESPHLLYTLCNFAGALNLEYTKSRPGYIHAVLQGSIPATLTLVEDTGLAEWHITVKGKDGLLDIDLFRDICVCLPSDGAHTGRDILRTSWEGVSQHSLGCVSSGWRYKTGQLYYGHDAMIHHLVKVFKGEAILDSRISAEAGLGIVSLMNRIVEECGLGTKTLV
jgi:scyllo-inositol 2-dehydrogenase (NADP+)